MIIEGILAFIVRVMCSFGFDRHIRITLLIIKIRRAALKIAYKENRRPITLPCR